MEYLVQIQVKKPNGKIHLLSITRQADTPHEALESVRGMSAGSGEIVGAYITGDPYKITEWKRTGHRAELLTVTD